MKGYVDGRVLEDARVPLTDRGYLLGDGVFETLRVDSGHVFRLDDHMERLARGLHVLGIDEATREEACAAALTLADAAEEDPILVRVNVTSGLFRGIADGAGPAVTGFLRPMAAPPAKRYGTGVSVVLSRYRKDHESPLSSVKHMSYLPHVQARREARATGAHDALLTNMAGRIAEATTSNVFAMVGATVHAPGPAEGALAGITRDVVLAFVHEEGVEVRPRLTAETLRRADEAWLTNTRVGCLPITRVDGTPLGEGTPGPFAKRMHAAYLDRVREEAAERLRE